MNSQGKIQEPPMFNNGANGCASTSAFQLFISLLISLDIDFEKPSRDYPANLISDAREKSGFRSGDFANSGPQLGDAKCWIIHLLLSPLDAISAQMQEFLGKPMECIGRKNSDGEIVREKPFFSPVLVLEGGKPLKDDIQEKLNGSVGSATIIGRIFKIIPDVLFVELPIANRQWQSMNMELEVHTRYFRKTQKTSKIVANMCGFICDCRMHYTAVVHYGKEGTDGWWYIDCMGNGPVKITLEKAKELFTKYGYVAAYSCKTKK